MDWLKKIDSQTARRWVGSILSIAFIAIFIAAMVESHYDEKHRKNALRYQLTRLQMSSVFKKLDRFLKEKDSLPADLDELVDFISTNKQKVDEDVPDEKEVVSVSSEDEEIKEELAKIGVGLYDDGWGEALILKDRSKQAGAPAMMVICKGPNGEPGDEDDLSYQWPDDREIVNR